MAVAPWVDKAFQKTLLDNPEGCKEPKVRGAEPAFLEGVK
jgi:hypothetical protein